jgi:hypothetical protein
LAPGFLIEAMRHYCQGFTMQCGKGNRIAVAQMRMAATPVLCPSRTDPAQFVRAGAASAKQ